MSKFQDLCELAVQWQGAGHDNRIRLWRATFQLTRGFAKYIDAPAVFADPKTGNAVRYVEAMRHGYRPDGTNIPLPVDSYMDALDMEDDGHVRFSIATAFEHGPETYPKVRVGVFLRMKIIGDTIHVVKKTIAKDLKGPGRGLITFDTAVLNQRDEPVLVFQDKLLLKARQ